MKKEENDERTEEESYPLWFLECNCRNCLSLKLQLKIKGIKKGSDDEDKRDRKEEDEVKEEIEDVGQKEPRPPLFQSEW